MPRCRRGPAGWAKSPAAAASIRAPACRDFAHAVGSRGRTARAMLRTYPKRRTTPDSRHFRRLVALTLWDQHKDINGPECLRSQGVLVYPAILHDDLEVLGRVGDQVDVFQR